MSHRILSQLIFATTLFFILNLANSATLQCQCDEYTECLNQTRWYAKHQFARCQKRCEKKLSKNTEKVPKQYIECMKEFDHIFSKIIKCTAKELGQGCSNNKYNIVRSRNLTHFHDLVNNKWIDYMKNKSLELVYKTEDAEDFNFCLIECFHPSKNVCTEKLNCGLLVPHEDLVMNIIHDCAEKNGVNEVLFLEVVHCLEIVMDVYDPRETEQDYESTENEK